MEHSETQQVSDEAERRLLCPADTVRLSLMMPGIERPI